MNYQHQHDINGCGIATLANLFGLDYLTVKSEFEERFYSIKNGIKVTDVVKYLAFKGLKYKAKHVNLLKISASEAINLAKQNNSIVLIKRSEKYPIGHFFLRKDGFWIDPWYNLPSINNVHSGVRDSLPNLPMYVILPC